MLTVTECSAGRLRSSSCGPVSANAAIERLLVVQASGRKGLGVPGRDGAVEGLDEVEVQTGFRVATDGVQGSVATDEDQDVVQRGRAEHPVDERDVVEALH